MTNGLIRMHSFVQLAKPKVIWLVLLTGVSAMLLEGSLLSDPVRFTGVLAGILLSAGAANAFNQVWDRDIDAKMERTRQKRPIPAGKVSVTGALIFSTVLGFSSLLFLAAAGKSLSAALGACAIFIYLLYTIWLKRRTSWNIVAGGIAGAMAPLIGWAAGGSGMSEIPLLMFFVIFFWTPPHFWALALFRKDEYAKAGIPMLPVVTGEKHTRFQMTLYVAALLPMVAYLGIRAGLGWPFFAGTILLGMNLVRHAVLLHWRRDALAARAFFRYSIAYLTGVFALIPIGRMLG